MSSALIIRSGNPRIRIPIIDQAGNVVGWAEKNLAEVMRVEAYVDPAGNAWTPPTGYAYATACAALHKARAELEELKK